MEGLAFGFTAAASGRDLLKPTSGFRMTGRWPASSLSRRGSRVIMVTSVPVSVESSLSSTGKDPVSDYVESRKGGKVIRRILIANNGMAATKAILSIRKWAYTELGDDRAIEFIAMATPEDLNANAEFIRLADAFVEVPGGTNRNNYANVNLIVDTALAQNVDAVWPGWGHASENPKLPNTLKENGIKFIGPPGPVMSVLGDKIAANILAQTAEVPSIPWSGTGLTAELQEDGTIPDETFNKACVTTEEEAIEASKGIGFPIMIKASEGGGGKGIRMVANEDELRANFTQVQNEVPGSPIFMMQLCKNARHLEVQIVGDEHGNTVALNGRDCSTQRRFQKIFEEGPPVIAKRETFREMEKAAQRLTHSIGYVGAGTVEYLYNAESDTYCFLELNPRLQVEHPVTEGLTGVNLPATQLQIAMGIPLYNIPDLREFFGQDRYGLSEIDFFKTEYTEIDRHVIAARITAENPDDGFKPTSGRIERVRFQSSPNVWGYFSVGARGGIHEFADSQFGHIFATGSTRNEARKALVLALKEVEARGDIRNPVDYLVQLLETDSFKNNDIDTSWLDKLIKEKTVNVEPDTEQVVLAAVIYRAFSYVQRVLKKFEASLEKGQTASAVEIAGINRFPIDIAYKGVKYNFGVVRAGPERLVLTIGKQQIETSVREQPDGSLLATYGGVARNVNGLEEPLGLRITLDGQTVLIPNVFDPSELRSDVNGKVVRFLKEDGDDIQQGEPYVEVESMKMIMQLSAAESGKFTGKLSAGSVIKTGDMLGSLQLKDASKVKKIVPFEGEFDESWSKYSTKRAPKDDLMLVMDGYDQDFDESVQRLFKTQNIEEAGDDINQLMTKYVEVEEIFSGKPFDQALSGLITARKDDLKPVRQITISHLQKGRSILVRSLIRQLFTYHETYTSFQCPTALENTLHRLTALSGKELSKVSAAAKELLIEFRVPNNEARLALLRTFITQDKPIKELARSRQLSLSVDLLCELFFDKDESVRKAAMEVYSRRVSFLHKVQDFKISEGSDGQTLATFQFNYMDYVDENAEPVERLGALTTIPLFSQLEGGLDNSLDNFQKELGSRKEPDALSNLLTLTIEKMDSEVSDDEIIPKLEGILRQRQALMRELGIRTVTLIILQQETARPRYYTFEECLNYGENDLRRNMRSTAYYILELKSLLSGYEIKRLPAVSRNAQLWLGTEAVDSDVSVSRPRSQRVFFRGFSLSDVTIDGVAEKILMTAMDELERALILPDVAATASSSIFLHFIVPFTSTTTDLIFKLRNLFRNLIPKHSERLLKYKVDEIDVKIRANFENDKAVPIRLVASSSTGEWLKPEVYLEDNDPVTGVTESFRSFEQLETGSMTVSPYLSSNILQMKRASARRVGSTYVYDFIGLFEMSVKKSWQQFPGLEMPEDSILEAEELVLNFETDQLELVKRPPGANDVGMVAWLLKLKTPEYPEGREVVVVANDVTFQAGSFGVREDDVFFKASEFARERGIPRVYLACNSGARIGLDSKLKSKFKVQFKDDSKPSLGFEYLYLTDEDYQEMKPDEANAHAMTVDGETRWVFDDIIGSVHGIGVENLRGSGKIAGETSRAYDDVFTLSYVTGRTVGIGAYLVRLGQRTIQMSNGPIILTGYVALNKLLGKDVYTTQDQLGGPQIMSPNGVSHLVVSSDQEGVEEILRWLSVVPKTKSSIAPMLAPELVDPVDREIDFVPTKTPYDPRHMLAGVEGDDGTFLSGFFDKGTFKEYLPHWGKSVVVGRARLGGIPFGVISIETRSVDRRIPADPGNEESREVVEAQAGQVWFPDSAYKTAQALEDFNRGENLPVMIFANWRGFSGGTRDMFGEILKYGSMIVDALRNYKQPVFIYLPPNAELRGGAWVVVDPTINEEMMEMYADVESRGGILEPPGICEVKFRDKEQKQTMHRLDDELIRLDAQLKSTDSAGEREQINEQIANREKQLAPVYLQIAHEFADLHDRAGRMKAKGVISDALSWKSSRKFFYWRAKRRILEHSARKDLQVANTCLSWLETETLVKSVCPAEWSDNTAVATWFEENPEALALLISQQTLVCAQNLLKAKLEKLSPEQQEALKKSIC
ncbi:hypothetical protein NDN08_006218 [Rhodosorus marinus]|uniref:Acetyl-CoA carboxylase n=1 Tax=Rhodosorus marinus TaxID=101924 RepID=A0AAV8UK33_9RHOD|nr:hypothetical protein NDN08_006218 [Rhodosorus marinus]